ncbi:MAG: hypothetical protein P8P74_06130 [Crocinitomicaceae bacterium]|nr:hypothetical protein [Crocinitomicaceae bacterium]
MKYLLCPLLICTAVLAFGQTDIIEMKSRNASLKKYERVSKIKMGDHVASNFGMAPMPEVKTAVLDSVKVLSDSTAVVYTSEYCTRGYPLLHIDPIYVDSNGREINEPIRTYPNPRVGHLWRPGADTVLNHPIFTQRHALDSVKDVIDRDYHFNLPSDSITFIGFDNGHGVSNKDAVKDAKHKREQRKNGFGWELIFMIITPIAFLLGMNRLKLVA